MEQFELGNQRHRTRKELLQAAARLLKAGRSPSMEQVAKEALVSRATAYRYFPSVEELLVQAPIEDGLPDPKYIFPAEDNSPAEERVDRAEAVMHDLIYRNETQLRLMLSQSLVSPAEQDESSDTRNLRRRRMKYIEEALAPQRGDLDSAAYDRLCAALALVFGTEAMVILRDVVPLSAQSARGLKSWMVRTLVRAALDESKSTAKNGAAVFKQSGRPAAEEHSAEV